MLTWFKRSRKGQRADCEAQWTMQTADKLSDDSSKDPASCPHWSSEPGELVMKTPLAKRVNHVLSCDYDIAS